MTYKRQEGFRFSFGEPIDANFVVLVDGTSSTIEQTRETCKVLDVSPRGMKILTDVNLDNYVGEHIQLEVYFLLDSTEIKAIGEVVWSKVYGSNFQYGLIFENQPAVEALVVAELKIRRRKEISQSKVK